MAAFKQWNYLNSAANTTNQDRYTSCTARFGFGTVGNRNTTTTTTSASSSATFGFGTMGNRNTTTTTSAQLPAPSSATFGFRMLGNQTTTTTTSAQLPVPATWQQQSTSNLFAVPHQLNAAENEVINMGFDKTIVTQTVEYLKKNGMSNYSARDILNIILDKDERDYTKIRTTTTTTMMSATSTAVTMPQQPLSVVTNVYLHSSMLKKMINAEDKQLCKVCKKNKAEMPYIKY